MAVNVRLEKEEEEGLRCEGNNDVNDGYRGGGGGGGGGCGGGGGEEWP